VQGTGVRVVHVQVAQGSSSVPPDDGDVKETSAPQVTEEPDAQALLQRAALLQIQQRDDALPGDDVQQHDDAPPGDDAGDEKEDEEDEKDEKTNQADLLAALKAHTAAVEDDPSYIDDNWAEMSRDVASAAELPGGDFYEARNALMDAVSATTDEEASVENFLRSKRKSAVLGALADGTGDMDSTPAKDALAASAAALTGKLAWVSGGRRSFLDALDGTAIDEDTAQMSCFEAVMYAALKANAVTAAPIDAIYKTYLQGDNRFGDSINDLFGDGSSLYDMVTAGTLPAPGDVIVFNTVEDHVALSLGGDAVLSLWNKPNGVTSYQETTITALCASGGLSPLDIWVKTAPFS
jgi:hypothetical protein